MNKESAIGFEEIVIPRVEKYKEICPSQEHWANLILFQSCQVCKLGVKVKE